MRGGGGLRSAAPPAAGPASQPHSPWRSPVPYLFGGLAAMMCLIGFSILILACSYWKLSGRLDHANNNGEGGGGGGGEGSTESADGDATKYGYEPKFLVIMAGQEKPTFIATPASMDEINQKPGRGGVGC